MTSSSGFVVVLGCPPARLRTRTAIARCSSVISGADSQARSSHSWRLRAAAFLSTFSPSPLSGRGTSQTEGAKGDRCKKVALGPPGGASRPVRAGRTEWHHQDVGRVRLRSGGIRAGQVRLGQRGASERLRTAADDIGFDDRGQSAAVYGLCGSDRKIDPSLRPRRCAPCRADEQQVAAAADKLRKAAQPPLGRRVPEGTSHAKVRRAGEQARARLAERRKARPVAAKEAKAKAAAVLAKRSSKAQVSPRRVTMASAARRTTASSPVSPGSSANSPRRGPRRAAGNSFGSSSPALRASFATGTTSSDLEAARSLPAATLPAARGRCGRGTPPLEVDLSLSGRAEGRHPGCAGPALRATAAGPGRAAETGRDPEPRSRTASLEPARERPSARPGRGTLGT